MKQVIVIASGDTERLALPHLLRELIDQEISLDIRVSPHGSLTIDRVSRVARAAYWDMKMRGRDPSKFVILLDADAEDREETIRRFEVVAERIQDLQVPTYVSAAKWHLEAWFFADEQSLRSFVGRSLGGVDASRPEAIERPKEHLRNLLDRPYTARVAARIAAVLSPEAVRAKSPSFVDFESKIRNGSS